MYDEMCRHCFRGSIQFIVLVHTGSDPGRSDDQWPVSDRAVDATVGRVRSQLFPAALHQLRVCMCVSDFFSFLHLPLADVPICPPGCHKVLLKR